MGVIDGTDGPAGPASRDSAWGRRVGGNHNSHEHTPLSPRRSHHALHRLARARIACTQMFVKGSPLLVSTLLMQHEYNQVKHLVEKGRLPAAATTDMLLDAFSAVLSLRQGEAGRAAGFVPSDLTLLALEEIGGVGWAHSRLLYRPPDPPLEALPQALKQPLQSPRNTCDDLDRLVGFEARGGGRGTCTRFANAKSTTLQLENDPTTLAWLDGALHGQALQNLQQLVTESTVRGWCAQHNALPVCKLTLVCRCVGVL